MIFTPSSADMSTLLESKEALRSRGLEVSLTVEEIEALITNRVDSLARLAFAACPPGEAPTNEQIDGLFNGLVTLNPGTYASMKRLIFEAQTLLFRRASEQGSQDGGSNKNEVGTCRTREPSQGAENQT